MFSYFKQICFLLKIKREGSNSTWQTKVYKEPCAGDVCHPEAIDRAEQLSACISGRDEGQGECQDLGGVLLLPQRILVF